MKWINLTNQKQVLAIEKINLEIENNSYELKIQQTINKIIKTKQKHK